MSRTFKYEQSINYPITDVFSTVYNLTIQQMESVGTAKKTPNAIVGTVYEYEMMLKKQKVTAIFTITEYTQPKALSYKIKAGKLENTTHWQFEEVGDATKISYCEQSDSDIKSASWTYRFLGFLMSRKQKKKAQQLIKHVEVQLYEALQKTQR